MCVNENRRIGPRILALVRLAIARVSICRLSSRWWWPITYGTENVGIWNRDNAKKSIIRITEPELTTIDSTDDNILMKLEKHAIESIFNSICPSRSSLNEWCLLHCHWMSATLFTSHIRPLDRRLIADACNIEWSENLLWNKIYASLMAISMPWPLTRQPSRPLSHSSASLRPFAITRPKLCRQWLWPT